MSLAFFSMSKGDLPDGYPFSPPLLYNLAIKSHRPRGVHSSERLCENSKRFPIVALEHQNLQKIKALSPLLAKYGYYVGENIGPLPYYELFTQSGEWLCIPIFLIVKRYMASDIFQ